MKKEEERKQMCRMMIRASNQLPEFGRQKPTMVLPSFLNLQLEGLFSVKIDLLRSEKGLEL